MITSYNFDFCYIEIYNDYVKAVVKEGVTVSPKHNDVLIHIAERHFKNRPFVYLTHRINSYAVNPTIYLETAKIKNLIGFAVVSTDPKQIMQIKIEKIFFRKEFKQFDNIESALDWKNELMKEYRD